MMLKLRGEFEEVRLAVPDRPTEKPPLRVSVDCHAMMRGRRSGRHGVGNVNL